MSSFLILKKRGPAPTDLDVVGQVDSKQIGEAVSDFGPEDEGQYIAVAFDRDQVDKQMVQKQVVLTPVTLENEAEIEAETSPVMPVPTMPPLAAAPIEGDLSSKTDVSPVPPLAPPPEE